MATKKNLIANLVTKLDYLSKDDAQIAVDVVLDSIKENLCEKNRIEIRGFGSMSIRKKKYAGQDKTYNTIYFRMSRNVQTVLK
ncbi:MAG: HU family DNA-binding protein [Rickettsiaceae bacterium]